MDFSKYVYMVRGSNYAYALTPNFFSAAKFMKEETESMETCPYSYEYVKFQRNY